MGSHVWRAGIAVLATVWLGGATMGAEAAGQAPAAQAQGAALSVQAPWSDLVPLAAGAKEHFVATDGKADAAGTNDAPWDLVSTLDGKHTVAPGDVIWVRGGTYKDPDRTHNRMGWDVKISGTEQAPVHLRANPGERATIDGGLVVGYHGTSDYLWIWDLEIIVSETGKETKASGSHPEDVPGPLGGLHLSTSKGCKFIDLAIHDVDQGMSAWEGAKDCEMHGCLIYDNGWKAPDRNHGHCIYTQNKDGVKTISSCILSTPYGNGQQLIQAYGSGKAYVDNFLIEDNIGYAMKPQGDRVLIGGGKPGNINNQALHNCLYNAGLQLGYSGKPHENCKVDGNVVFHGGIVVQFYKDAEVRDNLVVEGALTTRDLVKVVNEGNETFNGGKAPAEPKVVLTPNKYDPTRANLAIFNWSKAPKAQVKVDPFLKPGDAYRLMDPNNIFGKPAMTGTCDGDTISVPTTGEFGVFVVLKGAPAVAK